MISQNKLIILLTVIFSAFILSPILIKLPQVEIPLYEKRPDFELETVTMSMYNDSILEWTLLAEKTDIYKGTQATSIYDINGTIFNDTQATSLTFKASHASLENDKQLFKLFNFIGDYQLSNPSLTIQTPLLNWNSASSLLFGSDGIVFQNTQYKLSATSFQLNMQTNNLELNNNVTVTLEVPNVN